MTAEVVLILTAEDSAGRLWSGPPDQPPDVAVGSALGDGVCVTRDEWARYVPGLPHVDVCKDVTRPR